MRLRIVLSIVFTTVSIVANSQVADEEPLCTKLACCCCNYDPTPAGIGISHLHSKGEWMISYSYMNMSMKDLLSGTNSISSDEVFVNYLMSPDKMKMDMHMLMGMYGISNRFTAMLMLNYLKNDMSMSMFDSDGGGHVHPGSTVPSTKHEMMTSGIGDVQAWLLYALMEREFHLVMLSAGVNIPTGSIEQKGNADDPMYPGKRFPYAMQNGSGTFDFLPGITYLFQKNKNTFSAQALLNIPTGYNSLGYRKGNEINFNAWYAYRWHTFFSSSLRTQFLMNEKIHGFDEGIYPFTEPAANTENYGGERMNVFLGTQFNLKRGFWRHTRLGVEYGLPVYENLNGIQMKTSQIFNVNLSLSF